MQTYKEMAQIVKQAADKLVELEKKFAAQTKASQVESLVLDMREKGLVNDKSAEEKRRELSGVSDAEIEIHKKALELIGSRPKDIANLSKAASGNPEARFDSWVYGGSN